MLGGSVEDLAMELANRRPANPFLVTCGSQAVTPGQPVNPDQATLWGFGATVALEVPELHCVRIDLDPSCAEEQIPLLLRARISENQLALRNDEAFVPRLVRRRLSPRAPPIPASCLRPPQSGDLSQLVFAQAARRAPAPGEVEIRVTASGLNFRDVLCALGVYPGAVRDAGRRMRGHRRTGRRGS